mmetsp:Transcript_8209/g.33795  ORF Transcript_8209/g.33795 Transcript_8209/m.33795 type:complete len:361 (+) Transcript_8209:158-1240(+)|eukprot:CAMPEP_0185700946 /NCGR_PEP_ID=MMETSP1164-20130828/8221_1 /TAXON_ID=1104430 /ORGANISM="Chrysoreinhardia sp, Strain CCMP2950" /LENGTH=360 /DNA_ID=CAMNT_0028367917 /DNA_START=72 /DNA_END=1154 /DNA_ORIENTATION=+
MVPPPEAIEAKEASEEAQKEKVARDVEELNVLRRWRLIHAKAADLSSRAVLVENPAFDIDKTIFRTVTSPVARQGIKARLRLEPFWHESLCAEVNAAWTAVPRAPRHDAALLEFMNEECDFAMEHADGSFMDHLQFCYEYSYAYFRGPSPRVLLLHSILGVGSNYFPCRADKIPALRALLTEEEAAHVEAFPSMLRLIASQTLLDALERIVASGESKRVAGIKLRRVVDNAPASLDSRDAFWTHLNYQLIHLLDFIPAADWHREIHANFFFASFARLYRLLCDAGELRAKIDLDLAAPNQQQAPSGSSNKKVASVTIGSLIVDYVPGPVQLAIAARQIRRFSSDVGHSLDFELCLLEETS